MPRVPFRDWWIWSKTVSGFSFFAAALAQRLVRSICQNCKQPYTPNASELSILGINEEQATNASFMSGAGCAKCRRQRISWTKGSFRDFRGQFGDRRNDLP